MLELAGARARRKRRALARARRNAELLRGRSPAGHACGSRGPRPQAADACPANAPGFALEFRPSDWDLLGGPWTQGDLRHSSPRRPRHTSPNPEIRSLQPRETRRGPDPAKLPQRGGPAQPRPRYACGPPNRRLGRRSQKRQSPKSPRRTTRWQWQCASRAFADTPVQAGGGVFGIPVMACLPQSRALVPNQEK